MKSTLLPPLLFSWTSLKSSKEESIICSGPFIHASHLPLLSLYAWTLKPFSVHEIRESTCASECLLSFPLHLREGTLQQPFSVPSLLLWMFSCSSAIRRAAYSVSPGMEGVSVSGNAWAESPWEEASFFLQVSNIVLFPFYCSLSKILIEHRSLRQLQIRTWGMDIAYLLMRLSLNTVGTIHLICRPRTWV